jgi:acetolactate synthase-1/2/3 large subunit
VTGIATAYFDSIPLLVITGQVKSTLIGRDVFQEVDIKGATEPFVKHSYLLSNPKDFPRIMKEAIYIAKTGRPGPVLIDIPADYQDLQIEYTYPEQIDIRGYKPTIKGHIGQIKRAAKTLMQGKRPLICVGGGVLLSGAKEQFEAFVEKTNIPVVHTLMGVGSLDTNSPYNKGMIGTHGYPWANWALRNADTLLFIGARIADRAVANIGILDKNAKIIHIDIDPAEIGKITEASIPLVGDAKEVLNELIAYVDALDTSTWQTAIEEKRKPKQELPGKEFVNPKLAIRTLSDLLEEDAIITADVGQNQFWTIRNMEMRGERKIIFSGGFGTMGYSLPAGVGAALGQKEKRVVSIFGDGSFQMSLFELGTLIQEGIKPLLILFNNSGLGMVRELQRNASLKEYGVGLSSNPDFTQIVKAYGIQSKKVFAEEEVLPALQEALNADAPYFLEIIVDEKENTL